MSSLFKFCGLFVVCCAIRHVALSRPKCADLWIYGQGYCYRYFALPSISFAAATSKCQDEGAELVKVNSDEENNFLWRLQTQHGVGKLALGATDRKREGVWLWPDGTPIDLYKNWAAGKPSALASQNCLQQRRNGKWDDIPCNRTFEGDDGFICQKLPETPAPYRYNWFSLRAKGKKSVDTPLTSVDVPSKTRCAHLCTQKRSCLSFNLCQAENMLVCELLSTDTAGYLTIDGLCDHFYLQLYSLA